MYGEKAFSLICGCEEDWRWTIQCKVYPTGGFHSKGDIQLQNRKQSDKTFYANHKDKCIKRAIRWYRKNFERKHAIQKIWEKTHIKEVRGYARKTSHKRRRKLGYIPLNEFFLESEGHHIDREQVVHIPKELHKSIRHNVFTGENMFDMNLNAWDFLKQQYGVVC